MRKETMSAITEEVSRLSIEQKKMKKTHWVDLPNDVTMYIMEKLPWSERLPLRLVCKSWYECFLEIQNRQEFLPWIMSYYHWNREGDNDRICKLRDPSAQRSYIVNDATIIKERYIQGAEPCASRQGWVLFSKLLEDFSFRLFFLYSPFSNEVIELPLVERACSKATCSLSYPDCMVIAFWIRDPEHLHIKTCRPGDESWQTFVYSGSYSFGSISRLNYVGEFCYCVFTDGKLGAFNIKQQSWKILSSEVPVRIDYCLTLFDAFNGDLFICGNENQWKFWRFDLLENKWVAVEDELMKKLVVFSRGQTSLAIPAVGNARKYAGRILSAHHVRWFDYGLAAEDYSRWEDDFQKENIWIRPPFHGTWSAADLILHSSLLENLSAFLNM